LFLLTIQEEEQILFIQFKHLDFSTAFNISNAICALLISFHIVLFIAFIVWKLSSKHMIDNAITKKMLFYSEEA